MRNIRDLNNSLNYRDNVPYEETCGQRHHDITSDLQAKSIALKIPQRGICMRCSAEFRSSFDGLLWKSCVFANSNKTVLDAVRGDFGEEIKELAKSNIRKIFQEKGNKRKKL
jgi:hypothetical protein